jgi:hypothetical protein
MYWYRLQIKWEIRKKILENTFQKLDLFPSSGEGGDIYTVGSLRKS